MRLYLIRHGQSVVNLEKRHGLFEDELTAKGILDAKAIIPPIYDTVYSSDMVRALQTANIVFPDKKIIADPRLRERGNGVLGGKKTVNDNLFESINKPVKGAESLEECKLRAISFLKDLPNKTHCIVSHDFFIRILISVIKKKDITECITKSPMKNCEIKIIDY